jgi:hypothetical protein
MAHKTAASPSEQTQIVVHEIVSALRKSMPEWGRLGISAHYEFDIHIRDGRIHLLDTDTTQDSSVTVEAPTNEDMDTLIRRVEKWLFQCLPSRLVSGYHGRVKVNVFLPLRFVPSIKQQRIFDWQRVS